MVFEIKCHLVGLTIRAADILIERRNALKLKNILIKSLVTVSAVTVFALSALAQVVVTPADPQGWTTDDTRPGGTVSFVVDGTAPGGVGALRLTTNATTTAKAQYMHAAATPLADVNELKY